MAAAEEQLETRGPQPDEVDGLPEGWAQPQLGEIVAVNYGKPLKESSRNGGEVPVYGSNGIVGYHDEPLTHGPTIVIGRKGTVGAVKFSPVPCWPIDTAYFIDRFSGLDPAYLFHALRSLGLDELDTSTAVPGLNRDDAYAKSVPLSPLAEQRRIVEKVEQLLARVDASCDRLARVPEILKSFRQSVLAAACSGRLTADWREAHLGKTSAGNVDPPDTSEGGTELPHTWSWAALRDVCLSVTDGDHQPPPKSESGVPFLVISDISGGSLDFRDTRFVPPEYFRTLRADRVPRKGDILYSVTGSFGIPVLVDTDRRFCFQRHIALLRPSPCVLDKYLLRVLQSDLVYRQAEEAATGTAQLTVPLLGLRAIRIPLPPVAEQYEIARRVDAVFALADAAENRVRAAITRAEKLTQSILAKALRGELVPTEAELARKEGCGYEPATALLARIRREREQSSDSTRGPSENHRRRRTTHG